MPSSRFLCSQLRLVAALTSLIVGVTLVGLQLFRFDSSRNHCVGSAAYWMLSSLFTMGLLALHRYTAQPQDRVPETQQGMFWMEVRAAQADVSFGFLAAVFWAAQLIIVCTVDGGSALSAAAGRMGIAGCALAPLHVWATRRIVRQLDDETMGLCSQAREWHPEYRHEHFSHDSLLEIVSAARCRTCCSARTLRRA
jgi:hypothetical protein